MATGRLPAAICLYEESIRKPSLGHELQHTWFESHIALGALYERVGQPDDARRLYSALVERWKDGVSPSCRWRLP